MEAGDLGPPWVLSVPRYTAAMLHAGVRVMSPTAAQILQHMGTFLSTYLPRKNEEIPGQRYPATWLTLHMRVASKPPAKIALDPERMPHDVSVVSMGADDMKPNSNILNHPA